MSQAHNSQAVYAADDADGWILTPLDTLTALYHRRSGQTHLVSEPVPEILAAFAEGAADVQTLATRLTRDHILTADKDTITLLNERLDELVAIGLVWRQ